jgi:predicted ATP-dependent endonuclease of OLD family
MTLLTKVLYLYLSEIKNQVILIDEPEMSLHPNWQNSILELYDITQLFATPIYQTPLQQH